MKIAIFHELDFGGARRTVDEFAKRINKIFDVDLYYIDDKKEGDIKKTYKHVFFYPFHPKFWKGKNWKIRLYKDTVELYRLYRLHRNIAQDINSENYDLVFIHPSKYTQAPFILQFLKKKTIYYCQEPLRIVYDPEVASLNTISPLRRQYERLNRRIRKYIDNKNILCADHILVNSKYSQSNVFNAYGIESSVCYLGVNADVFKELNVEKMHDVLFIGNKDKRSGYKLFSDAISLIKKKPRVYVKLRASFDLSDKDLAKLYNSSRIVVVLTENEPFGLIPLEVMACAVPIIAVNEGGYKETIIDKKTGYLIERDSIALAIAIEKLLGNSSVASELGKDARKVVLENWTWDKTIDRFVRIIKYAK